MGGETHPDQDSVVQDDDAVLAEALADADLRQAVAQHRETRSWLYRQGIYPAPIGERDVEPLLDVAYRSWRPSTSREEVTSRRWRSATVLAGPLADQPGVGDRLERFRAAVAVGGPEQPPRAAG